MDQADPGADGAVPPGQQEWASVWKPRGGGDKACEGTGPEGGGWIRHEAGDGVVRGEAEL